MVCKHLTCGESIYPHCRNRSAFQRGHTTLRESLLLASMWCTPLIAVLVGRDSWISANLRIQPGLQSKFQASQSYIVRSRHKTTEYRTNNRPPLKLSLLCQVGGSLKTQEAEKAEKRLQTLTQQLNWLFQTSVGRHSGNGVSAKGKGILGVIWETSEIQLLGLYPGLQFLSPGVVSPSKDILSLETALPSCQDVSHRQ